MRNAYEREWGGYSRWAWREEGSKSDDCVLINSTMEGMG
jgi:hypothetical protein